MFDEVLRKLVERAPGGMASIIMALDGIIVSLYVRPDGAFDMELMAAEIVSILNQWRASASARDFGVAHEFVLRSDRTTLLGRVITPEYLIALVVDAETPAGKGRYLLRLATERLLPEF